MKLLRTTNVDVHPIRILTAFLTFAGFAVCLPASQAGATESSYLGGGGRTGFVDATVPKQVALQWVYDEKHAPRHAWREPNREVQYIDFDYATAVAIADKSVFFGSSADHTVYALDRATGTERWKFHTEGPVRFAPVLHHDRVYVASDDGYLYCLQSATGHLIWKFRGGPSDEKLIGNDQMISHWPARSGVLIRGDSLFFTAGMWSRDGVFIYCLNPDTGKIVWKNDTSGYHFATLPHSTGYAGVAPQGYLALHRGRLYVPTGRGAPAAFDATTGKFLWYENGHGYKPHQPGGSRVMAWRDWVIFKRRSQHTEEAVRYEVRDPADGAASGLYALDGETGEPRWSLTDRNIVAARGNDLILGGHDSVVKVNIDALLQEYQKYWKNGKNLGFDKNIAESGVEYTRSGPGKLIPNPAWMSPLPLAQWDAKVGRVFVLLCARDTILAGGRGEVSAIDFNTGDILWRKPIDGDARVITVVDDSFIVSSTAGKLYCFGPGKTDSNRRITHELAQPIVARETSQLATDILDTTGITAGYALMLGAGNGQLLAALLQQSDLVVYCLEPDADKAARIQESLDDAGWLGVRAAVHHGSFQKLPYNPYVANLIVWGQPLGSGIVNLNADELYRVLRPCGGIACQLAGDDTITATRTFLEKGHVPTTEVSKASLGVLVRRGKLPGAGEWTHAHANIGRTGCSEDALTRLPLGMLWWGGPGPARIVSRHWRAPVPVFANGTLYVQGQHDVFAVDAYNGREIWNRHLPNVGRFPPTHRGGNVVAVDDGVYCIQGLTCLKLDAKTGKTVREYAFPLTPSHRKAMATLLPGAGEQAESVDIVWEYLGHVGDYLLGTLGHEQTDKQNKSLPYGKTIQQSKYVFAFNVSTGQLTWEKQLDRSVSPTAIVSDGNRVYLLDRTGGELYQQLQRRGATDEAVSELKALDLATGRVLWTQADVPPAWKALMLSHELLVAYPNPAENVAIDGDAGVGVFACRDGKPVWNKPKLPGISETGRGGTMRHTFIVGDTLFLPWALDLKTGEEKLLEHDPLTGRPKRFDVSGKNFCGTFSAAQDLLIYRSASIGFAPISQDSGSYWLPESRPSCWISAIPAGGMVLAPEGYSTCICPYNYKTSLAMIPVERNENWSVYLAGGRREKMAANKARNKARQKGKKNASTASTPPADSVRTLRLNLNAPGDQMAEDGKLWLAWPRPVDPKTVYAIQSAPVVVEAMEPGFQFNSDYHFVEGTPTPWLYTSGITGPIKLTAQLSAGKTGHYDVALHFADPDDAAPKLRVFSVKIQDKVVLPRLDVAALAGGANKAVVKEFENIKANGTLTIELTPITPRPPLLCAVEIIARD